MAPLEQHVWAIAFTVTGGELWERAAAGHSAVRDLRKTLQSLGERALPIAEHWPGHDAKKPDPPQ